MTYEASGTIEIFGCANYRLINLIYYGFSIGSTVFSKPKALRGVYEKVVIKEVRLPKTYINLCYFPMAKYASLGPLYIDTLNAFWNEEDLVSYSEATVLIDRYIVRQGILAEERVRKCL